MGTLNTCQAFFPLLVARRGAIVNVASQAALVSLPQQAAYTAAKGAVAALTRSLAIDWAGHGVRVNAVAPGFTRTPMTTAFFENQTFTEQPRRASRSAGSWRRPRSPARSRSSPAPWQAPSRASCCRWTAVGRPASPHCPGRRAG